jgi:hypothetical protein
LLLLACALELCQRVFFTKQSEVDFGIAYVYLCVCTYMHMFKPLKMFLHICVCVYKNRKGKLLLSS